MGPEKKVVHSWPISSDKGKVAVWASAQLQESSGGAETPQWIQGKLSTGSDVTGDP